MKTRNMITLLIALCLCLCLCACDSTEPKNTSTAGQTQGSTDTTAAPQPETKTWGNWTVDVPAGYEFKSGDFLDETDIRYFSVKKSSFSYFEFKADGEDRIMNNYNYNKNTYTNGQKDVSGTFGGSEWVGFQYSDGYGGYGFEAYATVNGEMIRVSSAGYTFDNEVVSAVLGSLKYTPADVVEPETTEAAAAEPSTTAAAHTQPSEVEPNEGAPVYAKVIELKDVSLGIEEGYTEMKDGLPAMYVMQNDSTGGRVTVQNMSGSAAEKVAAIMAGMEYETSEKDLNGMHWTIGVCGDFYCFATTIGDDVLMFTIDYGATEQEMEDLIFGVQLKSEA